MTSGPRRDAARPGFARRVPARLAVVVAVVIMLGACGTDDQTGDDGTGNSGTDGTAATRQPATTAPRTTTPGTGDRAAPRDVEVPPLEWEHCDQGLECATLVVPIDWDDPGAGSIDVAVARRPASGGGDGAAEGVLALNPGGPGASGINHLGAVGDLAGLGAHFDLVSWDPRGVGRSTPLDCDDDLLDELRALEPTPSDPAASTELDEAAADHVESCTASAPALAPHLGTDQTVRDLDALRAALGEEQLSYLGFSYGTLIGQRYADTFPERVRAMVLDGVVDPSDDLETMLRAQVVGMEADLDALLRSEPGLVDAYESVQTRGVVTPATLGMASILGAYDPGATGQLIDALRAAADHGDGSGLEQLADRYWSFGSYPAYLGTLCADLEHAGSPTEHHEMVERLSDAAPRLGAAIGHDVAGCVAWPTAAEPPDGQPVRAEGAPPILVVGTTGDLVTPIELAERVDAALAESVLLTHEGEGHAAFNASACLREHVATYFTELATPAPGTVCADG